VSRRTERVGDQLRGELARLLHEEVQDPRLRLVTLTRVDVAPDLTQALVFWSTLELRGGAPVDEVEAGLESAAAFLRGRLARALSLKRMPQLRFRHDPSLVAGSATLALLREIADEQET
jgi:ribosome-binding factor A